MTAQPSATTLSPWLIRIVGVLGMVWNGIASYDFAMTMLRDSRYLAGVPADVMQYIDASPPWAIAGWGLGVGAGLAGSFLLVVRDVLAVWVLAASLAGLAMQTMWQISEGLPPSMSGAGSLALSAIIWIVATGLLAIAVRARRQGVLG